MHVMGCWLRRSLLGSAQPAAADDDLTIAIDEARLVPLKRGPAEIIVGNPSIADVSIRMDSREVLSQLGAVGLGRAR
jgi:hypothetical protein